jgi:hypothetical protein
MLVPSRMFLCPEAAFVMMALRDYANEVRQISKSDWIFGEKDGSDLSLGSPDGCIPTLHKS